MYFSEGTQDNLCPENPNVIFNSYFQSVNHMD